MKELKKYLGYKNPNQEDYKKLSKHKDNRHLISPYSDRLPNFTKIPELNILLRERIPLSPLFDIGAGPMSYGNVLGIAEEYNAEAYMGIDIAFTETEKIGWEEEILKQFLISGDMLETISKINSNSANFSFNGIDFISGEYLEAIIKELKRTTKDGGIIFGRGSELVEWALYEEESFREITNYRNITNFNNHIMIPSDFFIVEKIINIQS
tara:strand:- start:1295 stop:1924 length:630 start_codon:yes stop_codon:yes gene_type:complete